MTLKFYTQRDINKLTADTVSEDFIEYFNGLTDERKKQIVESNPSIATTLNYSITSNFDVEDAIGDREEKFSFEEISVNLYEGIDLENIAKFNEIDIEALTMRDAQKKCLLHRIPLTRIQFSYKRERGTYGVMPYYCKECNRLFFEESKADVYRERMTERNVRNKVYPLDISETYLKSKIKADLFSKDKTLYIPDVWVEENPTCPIHESILVELPYYMKYLDRRLDFKGYYCEQCNKVMVRKTKAIEIEEKCAEIGLPFCQVESLSKIKPKKEAVSQKDIKPDYYIENGKKYEYKYESNNDCYRLTEEDTVVISDSTYCNLEGHDTEEVMALIWVTQKRHGRKSFLCLLGYCSQCQKYYIVEEDYKVIYSLGRPEVTLLYDIDNGDYQITSGEVFDLEKKHLDCLEGEFTSCIEEIVNQSDYVNPYAVGSYDDGDLSYSKELSKRKYSDKLKKLREYIPKPYSYRVDITFANNTEVYYLGANDIELEDGIRVISFNKPFGKKLVNYRTIDVIKDGKKYDIKLSRQFDVDNAKLFGYTNIRTDDDIIFRSGITDPFLIKVLNMRKKQHNLVDIMATIQENQNKIVDTHMNQSIIVQGCAGSGKTMVLLHRLSSIKSNHSDFNLDKALILTPNNQFSLHIKGLADGLQIGSIERISVEEYYIELLCRYSTEFKPKNKLTSEIVVKQSYVDYIYSDEFLNKFDKSYLLVMEEIRKLLPILDALAQELGESITFENVANDFDLTQLIKRKVAHFSAMVKAKESETTRISTELKEIRGRFSELEDRYSKSKKLSEQATKDAVSRVYTKIGAILSKYQYNIEEYSITIKGINHEAESDRASIKPFEKSAKLKKLKKELDKNIKKQKEEQTKLDELIGLFNNNMQDKSDDVIIAWMENLQLFDPTILEEIRFCKKAKKDFEELSLEINNNAEKITELEKLLEIKKTEEYSDEVQRTVENLLNQIEKYSLLGIYSNIFDEAISDFMNTNKIKKIQGIHRYDLYAQLWFAMKYFKESKGSSRFICVDEGQDMSFNEYRLIYEQNQRDVIYNIYGDVNQLLKPGRGISSWNKLIEVFSMKQYELNENYRNTNQITRFCNASFGMEVMRTGVDGAKVREIPRKELEKELSELNINNEKIAILVPRRVLKRNYLQKDVIPQAISDVIGDVIDNGRISFMYVDEVKGIEFDKVYVITNKMSKNEKYIAYTRALSELIIVVDENIVDNVTENKNNSLIGEFVMEENTKENSRKRMKDTKKKAITIKLE